MELPVIWIGLAIACSIVASNKDRSVFGWFILGLLFSLIALIIVIVLPSRKPTSNSTPHPDTHVRCPDCREFVLRDARVCKHCGCKLIPQ